MSSSFYASSHSRYWLLTRPLLAASRETDLQYCSPRQLYCLYIYFTQLIQKLGKRLILKQYPIATACVFFRRFYLKNSICETNPYLVLAACVFVAAKVEETPVHIKSVVSEMKVVCNEYNVKMFPAETNKLGEMEFYLLEDLDFHLVVFHPYRALLHMTGREPSDSGTFPQSRAEEDLEIRKKGEARRKARDEEARKGGGGGGGRGDWDPEDETEEERIRRLMGRGTTEGMMEIDEGVLQISWFIVNDSFRSDVSLLYPPSIIALSAIYIAFCLTSMSSSNGHKTRTSSSQLHTLATSLSRNEELNLPAPPQSAAEFISGFQVSLPVLFGCVQEMVALYSVWEAFEPTVGKGGAAAAAAAAAAQGRPGSPATVPGGVNPRAAAAASGLSGAGLSPGGKKESLGMGDMDALVRKMIEERMVDVGHPDNAGDVKADGAGASVGASGNGSGKKRAR
ncbi:hypothetical protein IAT38_004697 [Cryptococcus sp. DSM 104549]